MQAWDNCGGVGKTAVNVTVSKVNLAPPKFLYATEFKAGRIPEYVVNPLTGSLAPTSQGSTWARWGPVDIASDPGGYRLYVVNDGSHDLNAYFINSNTGNLTQVPGSPVSLPGIGIRAAVHRSGKFVYDTSGVSSSDGEIGAFTVQSNGFLTPVPGSPFPVGSGTTGAITTDPAGKYLYTHGERNGSGAVAAFTINQTNGALTPLHGSPFPMPVYSGCTQFCGNGGPTDLGVDPSGKYLYAVLGIQDAVAGFAIDPTTGSLTNCQGPLSGRVLLHNKYLQLCVDNEYCSQRKIYLRHRHAVE